MKCDNSEPEEQTIARFLVGLDPKIANVVPLQQYWALNDVIKLSLKVERKHQQKEKGGFRGAAKDAPRYGSSSTNPPLKVRTNFPRKKVRPPTRINKPSLMSPNTRRCFKCPGFGHIASKCPNARMISFVEEEELIDNEQLDEDFVYSH